MKIKEKKKFQNFKSGMLAKCIFKKNTGFFADNAPLKILANFKGE